MFDCISFVIHLLYTKLVMSKRPTTIRLDPLFHKEVTLEAEKAGLTFSTVVQLLLRAFAQGSVRIGVTQYPEKYLRSLERESTELSDRYRKKKVKGYTSSKALFNDILDQ